MTRDRIRRAKAAAKPALARSANSMSINFWETLEVRQLLSASLSSIVTPAVQLEHITPSYKGQAASVQGITPTQIKSAYGFTGVSEDGAGQTIAIIDAYNDPNIASDLSTFDSQFGLAAPPSFKVVSQTGSSTLPATSAAWAQETSLDVEWAHAIAPDANILLVEATNESTSNLVRAVNYARNASGVSVVSMSWGGTEMSNETSYDQYFTTPSGHTGVSFVAAAGDEGAAGGAEWPAVSPNVIAVGGTTLTLNGNSYGSETVWSETSDGTSQYESTPGYQSSLGVSGRTTTDVSYDADPNTGFATYDSLSYQGQVGWAVTGGTSAGTPQWAGIIALADQGRVSAGKGTLDSSTQTLPALYGIYANATTYANDFNDITSGSNGSTYGGGYGGGGYTGGGGGYGGGGYGGGGYGGYGGGGYGGHHGRGYAFVHTGYGEITSAVTTAATTTGVSLTSATVGYDGPTGLGTPKAAGLISSLISYGATPAVKAKKTSPAPKIDPAITRSARPAIEFVQPTAPIPTAYFAVATPSSGTETPSLNRPEPRVDLETAVGLARPSSSAAATADSGDSLSAAGLGLLSGFLTETQTDTIVAKVAGALKPAAQSTAAIAEVVVADAKQTAAKFAATTAPLILAPEQVFFNSADIDASVRFNDALSSLTDELASIPRKVGATHSNARAWAVTGIVLAADAALLARYRSKRAAIFNERMKIAM